MRKSKIQKILDTVRALEPAEQDRLLRFLSENLPLPAKPLTEEQWLVETLVSGLLERRPRRPTKADIRAYEAYKPIKIKGKPLSETIIEERR